MVKTIFIFSVALFIALFTMWKVEAAPPVPSMDQLTRPPKVIEYQQKPHAVFDYGGLRFLFVVSKQPTAFPTCNAVQSIGKELMVVTSDPFGYVFFVEKHPVAFRTDHNPIWDELIKKSCVGKGCE